MAIVSRRNAAGTAAVGCAYFLATSATIASTRFDGGVAFLWIASAILTARLTTLRQIRWMPVLVACGIASAIATSLFGFGIKVAVPLALVNIGESVVAALILHRTVGRRTVLDSHHWLISFVMAAGMIAPALSALAAAGTVALVLDKPFVENALHWYSGHALGTLAFMPIAMMIMRGEAVRLIRRARRAKLVELGALILLVLGVSVVTFAQDRFPLLFLPLLPIVLATFRGGPLSTAASIVLISIVGAWFTLRGHGPIALTLAPIGAQMQFLQLYIAATMLTVLPANAELERRAELFRRLRESEARYRLVTEHSTDIVLNADADGRLRFVSTSVRQIGGHEAESLIGRRLAELVHPADAPAVGSALVRALTNPADIAIAEFRAATGDGALRWFELHGRAMLDDDGSATGMVGTIRDVSHRKEQEERLARAALTDPLTGLANRRAFRDALQARMAAIDGGCVALFDLDYFKRVNDTHGHAVGDEALRHFAAIARSSVRDHDLVARLGGEEFAVVLPDATIEQARLVCDRLRRSVARTRFGPDGRIAITVSGGVAAFAPGQDCDAVLACADAALYRAKREGRDRLALAA